MKLRNKKTGEIIDFKSVDLYEGYGVKLSAESLAELNEEWEDYEEPKEYWFIDADGELLCEPSDDNSNFDNNCREIGNYFDTREEAKKAVERLRAWKRLKDKGFKLNPVIDDFFCLYMYWTGKEYDEAKEDLKLLFSGGKE